MSTFTRSDILNLNLVVAQKFAPNMAEIVSLTVQHSPARVNTFVGIVADKTTGTVSYVPFVAGTSPLAPGYSQSTTVTLHTDLAHPALADAVTASVGLLGVAAAPQAAAPTGVLPDFE